MTTKYLNMLKKKAQVLREDSDELLPVHASDAGTEIPDSLKEEEDEKELVSEEDEEEKELSEEDEEEKNLSEEEDEEELKEEDAPLGDSADDKTFNEEDEKEEEDKLEESADEDLPTHPSAAGNQIPDKLSEEDEEEFEFDLEEDGDEDKEDLFTEEDEAEIEKSLDAIKVDEEDKEEGEEIKEEEKEELPESFKKNAKAVFEATVKSLVAKKLKKYKKTLAENVASHLNTYKANLKAKNENNIDKYLSYVAEEWMTENKLAVESGLKVELTEKFLVGLKDLFTEHYIEVPASKKNLVESLDKKSKKLSKELNLEINKNIALKKKVAEFEKSVILSEATKGMTDESSTKLEKLCENVTFSNADEFIGKVKAIKEAYFPRKKAARKSSGLDNDILSEGGFKAKEKKNTVKSNDPIISAVADMLSKSARK